MHLLTWILIGSLIGWGAGRALKGNGYGPFMDIFMGFDCSNRLALGF